MHKSFWFSLMLAASAALGAANVAQAQDTTAPTESVAMVAVNVNLADAETLARELQGIGPSKAQAIVDYRSAQGAFATVDELLEVKGIGVATLERIRNRLVVE